MKMPVLLIVDDEKPTRDALRMGFQDDYEVYTAANLSQAVTLLREESPDLVLDGPGGWAGKAAWTC